MNEEKAISMPLKDIAQLKIILATWYSFLRDHSDNFTKGDYSQYLKTPVLYDLAKDEVEVLFTGTEELLKDFQTHIFRESAENSGGGDS